LRWQAVIRRADRAGAKSKYHSSAGLARGLEGDAEIVRRLIASLGEYAARIGLTDTLANVDKA
jgi:hypothetical protein